MQLPIALALVALIASTPAFARKDCEELKREIAAKIDANGVKSYSLEIVAAEVATSGKIVGSCNGGTQRIAYQREAAAAPVANALAETPAQ